MGLGTVEKKNGTFLAIAGGFIWDKSKGESDPSFAKQEYAKLDGEVGFRQGAQYANLTGNVVDVYFSVHDEYGESIKVRVESGGEDYIISVPTNNRYSQDLMKVLLKMDLTKEIFIKPYDFIGSDKKRAQGISFRQNGEKIALRNDDAPNKDGEWFKTAGKKNIRRFFEDLSDWFVNEVTAKVIPQLSSSEKVEAPKKGLVAAKDEVKEEAPVKAKKEAKKEVKEEVKEDDSKVSDIDSQLSALMG